MGKKCMGIIDPHCLCTYWKVGKEGKGGKKNYFVAIYLFLYSSSIFLISDPSSTHLNIMLTSQPHRWLFVDLEHCQTELTALLGLSHASRQGADAMLVGWQGCCSGNTLEFDEGPDGIHEESLLVMTFKRFSTCATLGATMVGSLGGGGCKSNIDIGREKLM